MFAHCCLSPSHTCQVVIHFNTCQLSVTLNTKKKKKITKITPWRDILISPTTVTSTPLSLLSLKTPKSIKSIKIPKTHTFHVHKSPINPLTMSPQHPITIITTLLFLGTLTFSLSTTEPDNTYPFHGDYSPPSPPPPSLPPLPPSSSCEDDLNGHGSLSTLCKLNTTLELGRDLYIKGEGSLVIEPGVRITCFVPGCAVTVNLSGDFRLGEGSEVVVGALYVVARNAEFLRGGVVNVSALGGEPPKQTSGTPVGTQGAGGGHGGRGANCLIDNAKLPEDVWGGDAYAWSELDKPWSFGSKGGTTSKEEDWGGGGGGRVWVNVTGEVVLSGVLLADGGSGGSKGGGGSGGSVFIKARKMYAFVNLSALCLFEMVVGLSLFHCV